VNGQGATPMVKRGGLVNDCAMGHYHGICRRECGENRAEWREDNLLERIVITEPALTKGGELQIPGQVKNQMSETKRKIQFNGKLIGACAGGPAKRSAYERIRFRRQGRRSMLKRKKLVLRVMKGRRVEMGGKAWGGPMQFQQEGLLVREVKKT